MEGVYPESVTEIVADYRNTFSFAALHGDLRKLPQLLATQIYVVMGSNCVPIPGGMGVTDYLMLKGYQQLMSRKPHFSLKCLAEVCLLCLHLCKFDCSFDRICND